VIDGRFRYIVKNKTGNCYIVYNKVNDKWHGLLHGPKSSFPAYALVCVDRLMTCVRRWRREHLLPADLDEENQNGYEVFQWIYEWDVSDVDDAAVGFSKHHPYPLVFRLIKYLLYMQTGENPDNGDMAYMKKIQEERRLPEKFRTLPFAQQDAIRTFLESQPMVIYHSPRIANIAHIFTVVQTTRVVEPLPMMESTPRMPVDPEELEAAQALIIALTPQPEMLEHGGRKYKYVPAMIDAREAPITPWAETTRPVHFGSRQIRLTTLNAGLSEQEYPANQVPMLPGDLRAWFVCLDRHLPRIQQITPAQEFIETVSPLTSEHSGNSRTSVAVRSTPVDPTIDDAFADSQTLESFALVSEPDDLNADRVPPPEIPGDVFETDEVDLDYLFPDDTGTPLPSSESSHVLSFSSQAASQRAPATISVSSAFAALEESATTI
jgi:hypothetical protein